jgi:hypothetical protein
LANLGDLDLLILVVIVVVVIFVLVDLQTGFALGSNDGLLGVRKRESSPGLECFGSDGIVFNRGRASVISKHTKVDGSSLLRAVGSNEVLDLVLFELTVVTVPLELSALHVLLGLEFLVHHIFHVLVALRHASIDNALVQALLLIPAIISISFAVTVVLGVLSTLFLGGLHLGFIVSLQVSLHVDNVVSIVRRATTSITGRASITGAKAESNKALLVKTDIFIAIGFIVPLNKVVASLELKRVVSDPLHLLFFNFVFFQTTSLGKELLSDLVAGLQGVTNIDGLGANSGNSRKEYGGGELHGCLR